jgi:VanZ family protein
VIPRRWWPPVAWAAVVLLLTSIPMSSGSVDDIPGIDKLVHAVLYGVLGFLATRASSERTRGWQPVAATLLGALVFAALDEWHQSFIPGRSADPLDWVADAFGLLAGTAVALVLSRSERYT